jgi:hypothetical protein
MKRSLVATLGVAVGLCACAKGTGATAGQPSSTTGWTLWPKKEDKFVVLLKKKQDANLVRLAQQRAIEQAIEEQSARSQRVPPRRVPPSMHRTTEPPLPEPDLSQPIQDVPLAAPNSSPSSER